MSGEFAVLTTKEEMWARMLLEVLEDNGIPCTALPLHGAGFAMKTGLQDSLTVYVPQNMLAQATELMESLFSEDSIFDAE